MRHRDLRVRAAAATLLLAAGCSPGAVAVPWKVTFDSAALGARAVRVLASLHDGADCSGAVRYATSIPRGAGAMTVPPAVAPGRYTVCADAIDDACDVFGSGHTTVDLRGSSPAQVVVLIVETPVAPACPGSACAHGDCVLPDAEVPDSGPPPDAGADDATVADAGEDAGDAGMDAGCTGRLITAPTSPQCDAWTGSCIAGCGDQTCYDDCIAADSNPTACGACLDDAYDSCANALGCQAGSDAVVCCSLGCPIPTAASCCPTEWATWNACLDARAGSCTSAQTVCYR